MNKQEKTEIFFMLLTQGARAEFWINSAKKGRRFKGREAPWASAGRGVKDPRYK